MITASILVQAIWLVALAHMVHSMPAYVPANTTTVMAQKPTSTVKSTPSKTGMNPLLASALAEMMAKPESPEQAGLAGTLTSLMGNGGGGRANAQPGLAGGAFAGPMLPRKEDLFYA
jgi:hypothetical protein